MQYAPDIHPKALPPYSNFKFGIRLIDVTSPCVVAIRSIALAIGSEMTSI